MATRDEVSAWVNPSAWDDEAQAERVIDAILESGWPTVWCEACSGPEFVVEESDEQIGCEEQAREVRVTRLDCGHEIVTPLPLRRSEP